MPAVAVVVGWSCWEAAPTASTEALVAHEELLAAPPSIVTDPGGRVPLAFVTEISAGGDVVFEAELRFRNALSTGAFAWGQFDLVYRSERVRVFAGN